MGSLFVAPEASLRIETRTHFSQFMWVRPQTNRLLFEAGLSMHRQTQGTLDAAGASSLPGILDLPNLVASRNMQGWLRSTSSIAGNPRVAFRGSMSYVTGSHNLKFGVEGNHLISDLKSESSSNWVDVMTLFGNPLFANFRTHTRNLKNVALELGFFAQEQWTIDRLTVNAGVRLDRIRQWYPDQVRPASAYAPEPFNVEGKTATTHTDLQPRLGVAYDLFGDGKTALKVSLSRYGTNRTMQNASSLNPANNNAVQRRFWIDLNGDRFPQGDPLNPAPNGELFSPNPNPAFGTPIVTTFFDPDWAFGWGQRFSNWEFSGSVQQEVMDNISVNVGYFRRAFVNFSAQDNLAVEGDEFTSFTLLVEEDPRLPGGGGFPVTIVDINPDAFGRIPDRVTTNANNFGGESQTWNGVDVALNARLSGALFQGGFSTGRTSRDFCDIASELPETLGGRAGRGDTVPLEFCKTTTNWLTQVKILGSYILPYGIQVAGTYQSLPGPSRGAEVTFTSAQIEAALGRPLAGGGGISVDAIEPGTVYGERFHQIDLRLTKLLTVGNDAGVRAMFDLYNIFNANAVTKEENGFGPDYLQPIGIMPGRFAKLSVQFDF